MKLCDYQIVGAMAAPVGKAAFDRAPVVLASRSQPPIYVQVRAYVGADEVEGRPVQPEDWQALVRAEQGLVIPPVDAVSGVAFWLLRPAFESRDGAISELRMSGALRHDIVRLGDGTFGCFVNEPKVPHLRDRWAEAATMEALSWAKVGRWEHARTAASRAFVVERTMSPERVAMLSLAHERCGNKVGADGYVQMARNSRGDAFAQRVIEWRAQLEGQLPERQTEEQVPPLGGRPRYATMMHKASREAVQGGLRRLSKRAA